MAERTYKRLRARVSTRSTDAKWKSGFEALRTYVKDHGELPTVAADGQLGSWVLEVRKEHRLCADRSELDPQKLADLEAIPGWYWKISERHNLDFRVARVREWMQAHPHLEAVPSTVSEELGFRVDYWLSKMRSLKLAGELSVAEIELIETIPHWRWVARKIYRRSFVERELSWRLKTALNEEVRSGSAAGTSRLWNCDIVIPACRVVVEYDGEWAHRDRVKIDREKTFDLISAGWNVLRLRESPLSQINDWDLIVVPDEELGKLADRVMGFLISKGCTKRSTQYSHLLKYQGLREQADDPWYEGYDLIKRYEAEVGNCASNFAREYEGFRLRQWVHVQRRAKKRGLLSDRKIALLSGLATWRWETMPQLSLGWEEAYARVIEYQSEHGLYPSQGYKSADGFSLGGWVSNQRDYYRRGALSAERQSRLEELPKWWWSKRSGAGAQNLA